jgi:acyl-[acyl carrier protein]--UDP-N-acetylglucosamine O-acyltransferase
MGRVKDVLIDRIYNDQWINISGNKVHTTAIIHESVILGTGNIIGAYCVIGSDGEIRGKDHDNYKGSVIIGNNNVISEMVTIQRPFEEGKVTVIGNDNIIMAHAHIGHDAVIGDRCEICTTSIIAGYCTLQSDVKIKLGAVTRNRITIGKGSIVGMGSVVTKDVAENVTVIGNPAKILLK